MISFFRLLCCVFLIATASAQTISTFAGGKPVPDGVPALGAGLDPVTSLAPLPSGEIFFTTANNLFRIDPAGQLTIYRANFKGSVFAEASGKLLVTDTTAGTVTRLDVASGASTVVAGGGGLGCVLSAAKATAISLCSPTAAISDAQGNVYLVSIDNRNPNPTNCAAATGINRVDAGTGAFQAETIGFTACGFRLGLDEGFETEIFSSPAAGHRR
jgi:hypothetical protein